MIDPTGIRTPPPSFFEASAERGLAFEPAELERLGAWLGLLEQANQRMNLTRITDPETAWHRHVLDSLSLLPLLQSVEAESLLDVGSGGGAPGLPLAITMPRLSVGLIDSVGKKARFLQETIAALELPSVRVMNDRAESLASVGSPEREAWDVVCARAVGRLPVLLELTIPVLKEGGLLLAIKGQQAAVEIEESRGALHALHARVIDTIATPTGTVVVVEKARKTPKRYPRKSGEPGRNPLPG
ncbi:MAG: 16S rRNA (guanine(527)-N(7))-methyltransferase RsmG [Planctomycetota bacterium]|nr:16S rRNA (guanine(527)-N(7))-methyltransferase RsmG [Planctomycetota bacterium]